MSDVCQCGHAKVDHIYEEGACCPGHVCKWTCGGYIQQDRGLAKATEALSALIASAHRALDDPETVRRLRSSTSLPQTARILALHFEVEVARWAEEGA